MSGWDCTEVAADSESLGEGPRPCADRPDACAEVHCHGLISRYQLFPHLCAGVESGNRSRQGLTGPLLVLYYSSRLVLGETQVYEP